MRWIFSRLKRVRWDEVIEVVIPILFVVSFGAALACMIAYFWVILLIDKLLGGF